MQTIQSDEFSDQYIGVDIGPTSVAAINEYINNSKTVFWNGPVGIFEQKAYSNGTFDIAKSLAESSAVTIVGGDSIAALNESGILKVLIIYQLGCKFGIFGRKSFARNSGFIMNHEEMKKHISEKQDAIRNDAFAAKQNYEDAKGHLIRCLLTMIMKSITEN